MCFSYKNLLFFFYIYIYIYIYAFLKNSAILKGNDKQSEDKQFAATEIRSDTHQPTEFVSNGDES